MFGLSVGAMLTSRQQGEHVSVKGGVPPHACPADAMQAWHPISEHATPPSLVN